MCKVMERAALAAINETITLVHYLKSSHGNSCEEWVPVDFIYGYLGPLLLTWFNFNPSMDK